MDKPRGFRIPEFIGKETNGPPPPADNDKPQGRRTDPARPPRILVVEDEWFIAREIETMLEEAKCEVVGIAVTADEAVRIAETERPDLILMDIRLSGPRDGIAAAIEIKDRFGIRSLYVTAHSDPRMRQRGDAAEPLGWVQKPLFGDELVAAVRAALHRLS